MMLNGFRFSALRYAATAQRHFSTGQKSLIINAVGNDRLGIVSDMSKFVNDAGGNVGESQAAHYGPLCGAEARSNDSQAYARLVFVALYLSL